MSKGQMVLLTCTYLLTIYNADAAIIRNPYQGLKMLKFDEVVETLK
jgi:hypothetical protein